MVNATDSRTFDSSAPATGRAWARVADAGPPDMDRAVGAARDALDGAWGTVPDCSESSGQGVFAVAARALGRDRRMLLPLGRFPGSRGAGCQLSEVPPCVRYRQPRIASELWRC
jgi:hypothetical protein